MFWTIIAANRRKTYMLITLMGFFLMLLGYVIGLSFSPTNDPYAGLAGLGIAFTVWFVMLLFSLYGSEKMILGISGAREVDKQTYPQLYNIVQEMKIASSMPVMPRIYVVNDPSPNAFALGKSPLDSSICVTAGLIAACSRDELQGVIAHEIGHIINRDSMYMIIAATMLGSVLLISDLFVRSLWFGRGSRFGSRSRGAGGGAGAAIVVLSLLLAIFGPILARVLYFSISRKREYLADATSARLTRYPEGLASALEKIRGAPDRLSSAPSMTAPFYIVNPYKQHLGGSPFATHPPLEDRIRILRGMSAGAGYIDYVKSYVGVTKTHKPLIPGSDLKKADHAEIRRPSNEPVDKQDDHAQNLKKAGDIMRAINDYAFIACACGLKIKLPPEFKKDSLACPRCGRAHKVPRPDRNMMAGILATATALSANDTTAKPQAAKDAGNVQVIKRQPGQWQQFACDNCGHTYEISPRFKGNIMRCHSCSTTFRIED